MMRVEPKVGQMARKLYFKLEGKYYSCTPQALDRIIESLQSNQPLDLESMDSVRKLKHEPQGSVNPTIEL